MKNFKELTEEEKRIILAKREYYKEYRAKNKERIEQYQNRYWLKKSLEASREKED